MWVLPQAGTESKPRFRFKKRGLSTTPCKRVDWMTKFFSFCASGGAFADAETQDVGVSIRKRNRSASRFAPAVLFCERLLCEGSFAKRRRLVRRRLSRSRSRIRGLSRTASAGGLARFLGFARGFNKAGWSRLALAPHPAAHPPAVAPPLALGPRRRLPPPRVGGRGRSCNQTFSTV